MIAMQDLALASLVDSPEAEGATEIDLYFAKALVRKEAPRELFVQFIKERTAEGGGVFAEVSVDRLAEGLSYIEIGGWLGDQTDALIFMAIGAFHKAWEIISPETLGLSREEGAGLAGMGMVLTSGLSDEFKAELV